MAREPQPRADWATAFRHNGLTYASVNGREVCPDILITHEDVSPVAAAHELATRRSQRALSQLGNPGQPSWLDLNDD